MSSDVGETMIYAQGCAHDHRLPHLETRWGTREKGKRQLSCPVWACNSSLGTIRPGTVAL